MQSVLTSFFNELKEQIKSSSEKALSDFIKQQNFEQIFSSLKETVVELKNELKTLNDTISGQKETVIELKSELITLNETFREEKETVDVLKTELRELNDTIGEEKDTLVELKTNLKILNETFSEEIKNLKDKNELQISNDTFNEEIQNLKDKNELLMERFNQTDEQIQYLNQNQTQQLADLKDKLEVDYVELQQKIEAENSSFIVKVQELNDQIDSVSKKVNDINETLIENYVKKKLVFTLAHDISIEEMKSQGYLIAYDFSYPHKTTMTELNAIKSKCSAKSVLCAGGAAKGSDNLLLVSCGNCHTVLSETILNKPVLNNGAYWYLTNEFSFGFSPIYNVKQSFTDWYDCNQRIFSRNCSDNNRLSWYLGDLASGGFRIGKKLINHDYGWFGNYRKILFVYY
jgi:hypothetical protein